MTLDKHGRTVKVGDYIYASPVTEGNWEPFIGRVTRKIDEYYTEVFMFSIQATGDVSRREMELLGEEGSKELQERLLLHKLEGLI